MASPVLECGGSTHGKRAGARALSNPLQLGGITSSGSQERPLSLQALDDPFSKMGTDSLKLLSEEDNFLDQVPWTTATLLEHRHFKGHWKGAGPSSG